MVVRGPLGFFWEILLVLAYGTVGVYLMAHPLAGLASLTLAVTIYLSVEAMLESALWSQLRVSHKRWWLFFGGIVTVVILRTWPSSSAVSHWHTGTASASFSAAFRD